MNIDEAIPLEENRLREDESISPSRTQILDIQYLFSVTHASSTSYLNIFVVATTIAHESLTMKEELEERQVDDVGLDMDVGASRNERRGQGEEETEIDGGEIRETMTSRRVDDEATTDDDGDEISFIRKSTQLYCPVSGCRAADPHSHPYWTSMAGMRAHINAHLLGVLPGKPPDEWMTAGNFTSCGHCNKLVSRRCANGMHRTCWANISSTRSQQISNDNEDGRVSDSISEHIEDLPSLQEIFEKPISTQELIGNGLLPSASREFLKLLAETVHFNRKDVWQEDGPGDNTLRQRSRIAWTELMMFAKTCLPALPRGKAKGNRT